MPARAISHEAAQPPLPDRPSSDLTPVLLLRSSRLNWAGLYLALALAGGALVAAAASGVNLPWPHALPVAIAGAVVLLLAGHLAVALRRATARYRIFNNTIELETGIISRRIDNLQMFRVRDLGLEQGVLDRLLGVGDVIVSSTDESRPRLVLRGIRNPRSVYDTLRKLLAASLATRQTMIVESEPPSHGPS